MGITDPSEPYFKDGLWTWDGTVWRKQPLLFGYSDRWAEDLGSLDTGGGPYTKASAKVGAGELWILQVLSIMNNTGQRGLTRLWLRNGVSYVSLAYNLSPAQYEPVLFTGNVVLKLDDYVQVQQLTTVDDDVIEAGCWGYKMNITA